MRREKAQTLGARVHAQAEKIADKLEGHNGYEGLRDLAYELGGLVGPHLQEFEARQHLEGSGDWGNPKDRRVLTDAFKKGLRSPLQWARASESKPFAPRPIQTKYGAAYTALTASNAKAPKPSHKHVSTRIRRSNHWHDSKSDARANAEALESELCDKRGLTKEQAATAIGNGYIGFVKDSATHRLRLPLWGLDHLLSESPASFMSRHMHGDPLPDDKPKAKRERNELHGLEPNSPLTLGGDPPALWRERGSIGVVVEGGPDSWVACTARDVHDKKWWVAGCPGGHDGIIAMVRHAKAQGTTEIISAIDLDKGSDSKRWKLAMACYAFGVTYRQIQDVKGHRLRLQKTDLSDICKQSGLSAVEHLLESAVEMDRGGLISHQTAGHVASAIQSAATTDSRIAVASPPGAGKSTALRDIAKHIALSSVDNSKSPLPGDGPLVIAFPQWEHIDEFKRMLDDELTDFSDDSLDYRLMLDRHRITSNRLPARDGGLALYPSKRSVCMTEEGPIASGVPLPSCEGCPVKSRCGYHSFRKPLSAAKIALMTHAALERWEDDKDIKALVESASVTVIDDPSSAVKTRRMDARQAARDQKAYEKHAEHGQWAQLPEALKVLFDAVKAAAENITATEHPEGYAFTVPDLSEYELPERIGSVPRHLWHPKVAWPSHSGLTLVKAVNEGIGSFTLTVQKDSPPALEWRTKSPITRIPRQVVLSADAEISSEWTAAGYAIAKGIHIKPQDMPKGIKGICADSRLGMRASWRNTARGLRELASTLRAILSTHEDIPGDVGIVVPGKRAWAAITGNNPPGIRTSLEETAAVGLLRDALKGRKIKCLLQHSDRSKNDLEGCGITVTFTARVPGYIYEADAKILNTDPRKIAAGRQLAEAMQNIHRTRPIRAKDDEPRLHIHFGALSNKLQTQVLPVQWTEWQSGNTQTRRSKADHIRLLDMTLRTLIARAGCAPAEPVDIIREFIGFTGANNTLSAYWKEVIEGISAPVSRKKHALSFTKGRGRRKRLVGDISGKALMSEFLSDYENLQTLFQMAYRGDEEHAHTIKANCNLIRNSKESLVNTEIRNLDLFKDSHAISVRAAANDSDVEVLPGEEPGAMTSDGAPHTPAVPQMGATRGDKQPPKKRRIFKKQQAS